MQNLTSWGFKEDQMVPTFIFLLSIKLNIPLYWTWLTSVFHSPAHVMKILMTIVSHNDSIYYIYIHTYIHTYIYTYIHIYIHTYVYTYGMTKGALPTKFPIVQQNKLTFLKTKTRQNDSGRLKGLKLSSATFWCQF